MNVFEGSIGIIGLGRMGANILRRLAGKGFTPAGYDRDPAARQLLRDEGHAAADSLEELVASMPRPRLLWVMLPNGSPTEQVIAELGTLLEPEDIVLDGGNSNFNDDPPRFRRLAELGIRYLDAGVSGGVWGLERGYCLMIGGDPVAAQQLEPVFEALAPGVGDVGRTVPGEPLSTAERGFLYCGQSGAGHYVKMIHNGIEYGMMQSIAEGFDIMHSANRDYLPADRRYDFDLRSIAELWRRGSVVSSWLVDLAAVALHDDPSLRNYTGVVSDSGEGRWTVNTAIEQAVPAEALTAALYARFRSRQDHTFAEKLLSALRDSFGGHKEVQMLMPGVAPTSVAESVDAPTTPDPDAATRP